ncbi:hypothetical protein [Microbacterium allomyrinae]|uniref:Uncharacterized protein n=1 Tax=Microbacterium allomyrinae TaxID=2830666 RepID=A0A9X1LUK6_9MICO|nr:hypothetical protein [Microbacterium allomyrinae]MCC2031805.1 hypothetical protein [Microbacterium allomyrinae]
MLTGADELRARIENPALFAAADDLLEAEMARRGELTFTLPSSNGLRPVDREASGDRDTVADHTHTQSYEERVAA